MRRGPQANVADVDLTSLPPEPGSLCVLYAHEHTLAVTAHNQARHIAKPKPKAKPPAPAQVHYAPPPPSGSGYIHSGEPCGGSRSTVWTIPVNSWSVPPGCFGGIFSVNPWGYSDSAAIIGSYGWCNWWPEAITGNPAATQGAWHSSPWVGAVIHFAPGDQGAGGGGHWGYVESIGPNGWILISEMNMYWRGGGWQKVDYRYIHVDGGTSFI